MEIFGYIASVFIGISLGLIGGGGSILTVPVLVYFFGIDVFLATEYSLFIVGVTSMVGSFSYFKKGLVHLRTAFIFGIPSIVSIFLTRNFLLLLLPDKVFKIGSLTFTKDIFILVIFAGLMIVASYKMIHKSTVMKTTNYSAKTNTLLVAGEGSVVGILTGLVGAGGGFMIIPALVNLLRKPMKVAIGTSLVIISLNSLVGFFSSMNSVRIEWHLLATISAVAILGIIIGSQISKKIDGKKLKPAFGWFVLIMGIYILIKELFL
ncbi:sulfite exporter TauE/SafE family protein [Chryseobacterium chendengshani]|uniref:sulfite exporter TauE/SafE family protein n=1 Tax=Chryseobacterium sp. LJ668 TaxID=2864040 RepID=UPI001C692D0B|nr:sulfite exporter TauE/SafE family protein [Chryseobacterium sp. LJ668]MBW8523789.1 sulfite exporter TauE/SafE family protein [Chryseobacterium sp. LJ668]QYK16732.1 sulfite exporter TauE/SafE family protein [Chryseobacterium sp. LJ668]